MYLTDFSYFNYIILSVLLVNLVSLACFDYHGDETSTKNKVIRLINMLCTIVFTVEALLKMLAFGFIQHPKAYLRGGWHQIEALIVIFA